MLANKSEVTLLSYHGTDRQIAEAAWTSCYTKDSKEKKTDEQVEKLVRLLASEGHLVPFEHNLVTFHLKIPIFIDRQIVKHRIGTSHSGMSGRYRTMPNSIFCIPEDVKDIMEKSLTDSHIDIYLAACVDANDKYQAMIKDLKDGRDKGLCSNDEFKRAREVLRGMLPQANMTETVISFNLRSLSHFVKLRDKPNAQPEIQFIAKEMVRLLKEANFCPVALDSLLV